LNVGRDDPVEFGISSAAPVTDYVADRARRLHAPYSILAAFMSDDGVQFEFNHPRRPLPNHHSQKAINRSRSQLTQSGYFGPAEAKNNNKIDSKTAQNPFSVPVSIITTMRQ